MTDKAKKSMSDNEENSYGLNLGREKTRKKTFKKVYICIYIQRNFNFFFFFQQQFSSIQFSIYFFQVGTRTPRFGHAQMDNTVVNICHEVKRAKTCPIQSVVKKRSCVQTYTKRQFSDLLFPWDILGSGAFVYELFPAENA